MEQNLSDRQKYSMGSVIFQEGSRGACMYYVHSGRVGIYSHYGMEEETFLTSLDPGSFFGEMGMVRGLPRSATAVALLPGTEVAVVTWETLGSYFRTEPAKVVGIMQQMSNRIAELTVDYIGACGEITRLVGERSQLEQENRRLLRDNSRSGAVGTTPASAPFLSAPSDEASAEKTGKSQKSADARLKKYMDAYRRYMSSEYAVQQYESELHLRV